MAADDSGTEDVTETRIDSTRPKTAKMFARCPKEKTDAICRRLPDRALGITRCGITIRTGIRALSSRTADAWAMPTGSRRSRNARAPALWMIRCHLAINQWKLDRATERLHVGTTKRNVTLANRSCMEAARATRTTTQRRVPAITIARNLEFTSRAAHCQWRLAVVMASWPVGTLPGTIINACPSTTPVVVAIITSLSRWTSAKSSVHRRSRKMYASCRPKLANVRTTLPTGTSIRKSPVADSSTTVDAAAMETTLPMKRPASTDVSRVAKRRLSLSNQINPRIGNISTAGNASSRWTPAIAAARTTNVGITMTAVRESVWNSRTPDAEEIRTTSNDTTNARVLAEVLKMLVLCDRSTDGATRMRPGGTTISAANGATRSRSVDVKAMPITFTRNRIANGNVGLNRLQHQNRNENRNVSRSAQHSRPQVFATNRTNTAPAIIQLSSTFTTRNEHRASRITTAEKVAMETGSIRRNSVNGNAENTVELMYAKMPRIPDLAEKPSRDTTTIRERGRAIRSTTAAAKAMETDLQRLKSANRPAWTNMLKTKSILAKATTKSAGRSIVRMVLPGRTIRPTTVNGAPAKNLVPLCDAQPERNAPWICRVTIGTEPHLWPYVDQLARKANVLGWLMQRFARMLAERMPTVAAITSVVKLDALRYVSRL